MYTVLTCRAYPMSMTSVCLSVCPSVCSVGGLIVITLCNKKWKSTLDRIGRCLGYLHLGIQSPTYPVKCCYIDRERRAKNVEFCTLAAIVNCSHVALCRDLMTFLSVIPSANVDRFSKYFGCLIPNKIFYIPVFHLTLNVFLYYRKTGLVVHLQTTAPKCGPVNK